MNTTELKTIIIGFIAMFLFPAAELMAELGNSRPNIIFILTDDQGYGDLECHGHPFLKTQNLDKLYEQSTRFTDFHASPTCAPTRSALMSGKAPFRCGITHTILERERMALGIRTVAEVLKASGYHTGIFGKWHLGDEAPYQPENRGFEEVFIHGGGGIGQNFPVTCADVPGNTYFDPIIKHNGVFEQTKGFCTDVFFKQALGWIKSCKDQQEPFFAFIPSNAPHGPFIAPEKYKALYREDCHGDEKVAAFYGMIHNIDDNVGILMNKMEEWGLNENTLLIFMTDNGSVMGYKQYNAGMRGGKGSLNEGGARVPLFMRWNGKITPGKDVGILTRHYDLFPTLAEFAGAEIPEDLDGRSLIPLLEQQDESSSEFGPARLTFFHQGRWNKAGAPGKWGEGNTDPDMAEFERFAVRSEKLRLVGLDSLYDIANDPGENVNVIKSHQQEADSMLVAYEAWWDEVRPFMVNEDAPLDREQPFVVEFERQKKTIGVPLWKEPDL